MARKFIIISLVALLGLSIMPSLAEAIPAFARKYDVTCTVCHTKPPRLNPFGEAFHMAGFQMPMTEAGEILGKRKIGRVNLETDFMNIFALRANGNFVESFASSKGASESNITIPTEAALYMAGTITQDISFFFEFENEAIEIEGNGDEYESKSRFGLGKEFFVMFNLDPYLDRKKSHDGSGLMMHGPMVMIGKIDPSTNFSYSTNRQFILNLPGKVKDGTIERFGLTPYAFASKFYGMKTGNGDILEVTKSVLYNTTGDMGVDVHGMVGHFLYQVGAMQGASAGFKDANEKKDIYFVGRYDFGTDKYFSGSVSGLYYIGSDSASVSITSGSTERVMINWKRYGFGANIKSGLFDLYGAIMWDKISGLPSDTLALFKDKAMGITVEADYLFTDKLLVSGRYDSMQTGGFKAEKEDGSVLHLQARYYVRDNFALFLRESFNLQGESNNALNNYQNVTAFGVDMDF